VWPRVRLVSARCPECAPPFDSIWKAFVRWPRDSVAEGVLHLLRRSGVRIPILLGVFQGPRTEPSIAFMIFPWIIVWLLAEIKAENPNFEIKGC